MSILLPQFIGTEDAMIAVKSVFYFNTLWCAVSVPVNFIQTWL